MDRAGRITGRAVLLATCLAALWAATSPYTDQYAGVTWSAGWGALPAGPVAAIVLLVLANGILVRLRPSMALSRAEVLIVYSLLTISAAVVVVYVPYMLGIAAYPHYQMAVDPWWQRTILPYPPSWLHPSNPEVVPWFWEGLPQGASLPWRDWVTPVLSWGGFALAMLAAMLCLGALLRKDWIEQQRLTFPLTEIPMGVVGDQPNPTLGTSVFRQKVFWVGFSAAGAVTLVAWLSSLYPAVPDLNLRQPAGQGFADAGLPWSSLSGVVVSVTPATVGIMCLIPTEVSLSLWGFYLLFIVYLLICGSLGIPAQGSQAMGGFNPRAFADYAGAGGFAVVSAMVLYQSRSAFRSGLRSLLRRRQEEEDPRAPMSNGIAVAGFVAANAFMLWWALRAQMSWWSFGLLMSAFYVAMIGSSRLVAAAGLTQPRPSPSARWMVIRTLGAGALDPRSLVMYSYLTMGYMLEPQNLGIIYMMNSFKLIHAGHIRARRFPAAVTVALLAALLAGSAGLLYTAHRYGAITMECWPVTAVPTCAFREFNNSLNSPEDADAWLRVAMLVGAAIALLLFRLTSRFVWWPLTPIGFIVASVQHTNEHVWTNALIGWTISTLIRRYGGLRLYRTLRPAFLGLVLGQFLVSTAMALFSAVVLGARSAPSLFT